METKGLIGFAVTAKLICAFVFAYAKCWFSPDMFVVPHMNFVYGIFFCLSKVVSNFHLNFFFFQIICSSLSILLDVFMLYFLFLSLDVCMLTVILTICQLPLHVCDEGAIAA